MHSGGIITLRDLIKWGGRLDNQQSDQSTKDELAMEGYCLLVERLRDQSLRSSVMEILEKVFKVKLNP